MDKSSSGLQTIWSVNEWGKLREIILGNPIGAYLPSLQDISQRSFDRIRESDWALAIPQPMPQEVIEETLEDLQDLSNVLTGLGVKVHQASSLDSSQPVRTADWVAEQENCINIRDITLIHGDLIIGATSPTRGRYEEGLAVGDLLSSTSAKRTCPPRPRLLDNTYDIVRSRGINNYEPLFDAANCVRLGRDIVIDINNTANQLAAEWLQQTFDEHFGAKFIRVHPVSVSPDHLDVILVPLCEGKMLYNPQYVNPEGLPDCIKSWDLIPAPEMIPQDYRSPTPKASNWIGLNLLVVDGDQQTVIVEKRQTHLIRTLERSGFRPIPMSWRHGRTWGGGFHCVTLDTHREGDLYS